MDLIDAVLDIIEPFLARLADDSSFRSGVGWGLLIALFIGLLSRLILYFWNKVLQFPKPTRKPATSPGPSPLKTFVQAILSFLALAIIVISALLVAARYLGWI